MDRRDRLSPIPITPGPERTGRFDPHPIWETVNGGLRSERSYCILADMGIPERIGNRKLTHIARCWLAYDKNLSLGQPPMYDEEAVHFSAPGAYDGCDRTEDMYQAQGHNKGWALTEGLANEGGLECRR